MHKYRLISKKGEGTFSEVLKAQSIKTGKYVAIKCMKNHFDSIEQVNNLREIQALRRLSPHPQIIKLYEVLYDEPTGRLALVFELMDMNMYDAIKGRRHYLPENRVKYYMYQLLKSIDHMHRNGIFHRDIKPENILLLEDQIKLADFGSCRGIYSKQPYTEYISTRWYRAPECLLTDGYYGYKMDLWGIGCVIFEVLSLFPLFPGNDELDQVHKIHNIIGSPQRELLDKFQKYATHMEFNFPDMDGTGIEKLLTHVSKEATDIIYKLLIYNPDNRITASQALKHPWFKELREQEKMLKQQYAGSLTQSSVRAGHGNLGDSISQYSKQSEEIIENQSQKMKGSKITNKNKQYGDKFIKTQKKLPDLKMGYIDKQGQQNITFSSDSEDPNKQLPQIKGSGQINQQIMDAYVGYQGKKQKGSISKLMNNQNQYMTTNLNQGQVSPSQTFFKGNNTLQYSNEQIGVVYGNNEQYKKNQSFIQSNQNNSQKKQQNQQNALYKNSKKYVSPYSQKLGQK